jgi:hypothetical protein
MIKIKGVVATKRTPSRCAYVGFSRVVAINLGLWAGRRGCRGGGPPGRPNKWQSNRASFGCNAPSRVNVTVRQARFDELKEAQQIRRDTNKKTASRRPLRKPIICLSGGCACGSALPLPAPAKQTHRAKAGGEKWESGGKWRSGYSWTKKFSFHSIAAGARIPIRSIIERSSTVIEVVPSIDRTVFCEIHT